jgi:hypothetical protein
LYAGLLQAQNTICDPHLALRTNDPYGYRLRGDRCEGLYIREVAGSSTVFLASLTRSTIDFDLKSGNDLVIEWRAPSSTQPVRLRAAGLRPRLYYQMDTVRPAGATSYSWHTGMLTSLNIKPGELGLVAWSSLPVGAQTRDVYFPLDISHNPTAGADSHYNVTLAPSVELSEVYVTVTPLSSNGRTQPPVVNGKNLGFGYYPAMRPFSFPVPRLTAAGIYQLDIAATLRTGEPSTLRVWFYHAGM